MNDFEELARRSVEAADDSVRRLAVPDIVARRRRRPVVLGLALGALLLVVGVVVWQAGDGSTPTEVAGLEPTGGTPAVDDEDALDEQFRLEWPTSGDLDFVEAGDFSFSNSLPGLGPVGSTKLYGSGPPERPFSEADLLLVTFTSEGENEFSGEEIVVRGTVGWKDVTIEGLGFEQVIAWREPDGPSVVVASRSMNLDEILAVVEALEFRGAVAAPASSSLDLLAEVDSLPFKAVGSFDLWQLVYQARPRVGVAGLADSVSLVATAASADFMLLQRYMFAPDASSVVVRGTTAWSSDASILSPDSLLIWSERGFTMLLSVSADLDPVEIANTLVEIDEARWAELVAASEERGRRVDGEIELIARGEFEANDGTVNWQMAVDESLLLCLSIEQGESGTRSCASTGSEAASGEVVAPRGLGTVSASVEAGWLEIQGAVGDDVDRLEVRFPDGSAAELELYSPRSIDSRVVGWVTPLRPGDGGYALVALAADGTEIESRLFRAPTPTVDPLQRALQGVVLGEGTTNDLRWALRDNDGELCLFVLAEFGAGTCGSGFQSLETFSTTAGSRLFVSGLVGECVASVELVQFGGDGEVVSESSDAVADESRVFFVWATIEAPNNPMTLILRDADGAAIAELDARGVAQLEDLC